MWKTNFRFKFSVPAFQFPQEKNAIDHFVVESDSITSTKFEQNDGELV